MDVDVEDDTVLKGEAISAGTGNGSTVVDQLPTDYVLVCDAAYLEELAVTYPEGNVRVNPQKLHWTPFYIVDPKKDKWSLLHLRQAATSGTGINGGSISLLLQSQQQQALQSLSSYAVTN